LSEKKEYLLCLILDTLAITFAFLAFGHSLSITT